MNRDRSSYSAQDMPYDKGLSEQAPSHVWNAGQVSLLEAFAKVFIVHGSRKL